MGKQQELFLSGVQFRDVLVNEFHFSRQPIGIHQQDVVLFFDQSGGGSIQFTFEDGEVFRFSLYFHF